MPEITQGTGGKVGLNPWLFLIPFDRYGNRGPEDQSNLSEVTPGRRGKKGAI